MNWWCKRRATAVLAAAACVAVCGCAGTSGRVNKDEAVQGSSGSGRSWEATLTAAMAYQMALPIAGREAEDLARDAVAHVKFWRYMGKSDRSVMMRAAALGEALRACEVTADNAAETGDACLALYCAQAGTAFLEAAQERADFLVRHARLEGGRYGSDAVAAMRLFHGLAKRGLAQYELPRDRLWAWIELEEPEEVSLGMARFVLEERDAATPDWLEWARDAADRMAHAADGGVLDKGAVGCVTAQLYGAGGGDRYQGLAARCLNAIAEAFGEDGAPPAEGGGPVLASVLMDAMLAVPAWADGPRGRHARPAVIGFHEAHYNADGKLVPYAPLREIVRRELAWYRQCAVEHHGYPSWVYATFINDDYRPFKTDIVPGCQNGMGILGYLKYWRFTGNANYWALDLARKQGDFLIREALTPNRGAYPRFVRSTGNNEHLPLERSSQGDALYGEHVIEPDKGGIAGYALLELHEATGEPAYFDHALHQARVLAANMRRGTSKRAPWPFRVDAVSGRSWGERNGNMAYILRLFDGLLEKGYSEFAKPRADLWSWIRDVQIYAPDARARNHWIQFFEDQTVEDNRTSWAPLEMARYLIEQQHELAPNWKTLAEKCIEFALRHFSKWEPGGVTTMCEQDVDLRAWGGACSKLAGVAAMFYAAGGGDQYGELAYRNLVWMAYHIDKDGCPGEITGYYKRLRRAGWQTDCHTDKLHNFLDVYMAVPEWAAAMDWPVE